MTGEGGRVGGYGSWYNLSLDAALLAAIDEAAKARGLTRSAFVASAAREKIAAES
jgi:metal-responsive CopG/Arc/MetJ family transcriptional regulator